MFAGIDVGTSLVKIVLGADADHLSMVSHPRSIDPESSERLFHSLLGSFGNHVKKIAVTGSGAAAFAKVAREQRFEVIEGLEDSIAWELHLQVRGVKEALVRDGIVAHTFLLVSIGTGTSFTRVIGDEMTLYQPGLSVGGSTIAQLVGLRGIPNDKIGELAENGADVDLLMGHVYHDAGTLRRQFVLASLGRLDQEGCSDENLAAGLLKMVATLTIGHILSMRNHPDWKVDGPIVFIGTPVTRFKPLARWLTLFTGMLGLRSHIPEDGAYAGAIGAFHLAQTGEVQRPLRRPGGFKRVVSRLRYLGQFLRAFFGKR